MLTLGECWTFLRVWGSVFGLAFDVVGAVLVYLGVKITMARAYALEDTPIEKMMDDLGSDEILAKHEHLKDERARERLRASRWALCGFVLFIIGFILQAIGSWPKQ